MMPIQRRDIREMLHPTLDKKYLPKEGNTALKVTKSWFY